MKYIAPVLLESLILFFVAGYGQTLLLHYPNILAYLLLFAMGVQNSLVTTLSNSVVRTTHLTGLFTDLGIELAQLFFYKQPEHQSKLWASIQLRLAIIISFFIGGVTGGIFYAFIQLHILSLAAGVLLLGVTLDYWKLKLIHLKRKQLIRLKRKQIQ